jgi:hypothetical protein
MPSDPPHQDADPPPAPETQPGPLGRALATAGAAAGAALGSVRELPGMRVRRIRRRGAHPLPSLPDLYPEIARARRVDVGTRTIDVADIRGTAVGGGTQRGGDFLPLRHLRGRDWNARWQRLRRAHERLVDLPPIDVVKFDGGYWVVDGHNRVALALYTGQVGIDASITELVLPGSRRTEPIGSLEAEVEASRPLRGRIETARGVPAPAPERE